MGFEFETTVDVRYADLDTYGHVNNAVYATFLEEARVDYLSAVIPDEHADITGTGDGLGIVLASLELAFEASIGPSDEITVAVRVPRLGESSFPFEYEIRSDGAVLATGETTVVVFDRESRESRPIPDPWREAISEYEGL